MNEWFLGRLAEAEHELRSTEAFNDEELGLASATGRCCSSGSSPTRARWGRRAWRRPGSSSAGGPTPWPPTRGAGAGSSARCCAAAETWRPPSARVAPSIALLAASPLDQAAATATLAAVLLGRGRTAEALAAAHTAMDKYEAMGAFGYRGAFARLVLVEALEAAGMTAEARSALATARDHLLGRAAAIPDPDMRRTFLHAVPENARTLMLARDRLGASDAAPPGLSSQASPPASAKTLEP